MRSLGIKSSSAIRNLKLIVNTTNLYDRLFVVLLVVDVTLRLIWLDKPKGSLIFDEYYYVNVARVILGLPQSLGASNQPPYVNAQIGLDPNREHPPLAKLLIALSMYLQGDNAYGWRIPSVIFGSVGIFIFYLLMKKITNYKILPLIASFLFSFDNLILVHSRIATLDIFTLTFMLLGFYWYFSGHPYLSAIGMALSALTKISGVAGLIIIIILHVARSARDRPHPRPWNEVFAWFEKYFVIYVGSFLLLLTIMDRLWVGYSNPFSHIEFIINYSIALTSTCPSGIISCPWQWLINQIQIPYLIVSVSAGDVKYDSIAFLGAMNPAVLYLAIPAVIYSGYNYFEKRSDFPLFMVVWFVVTYLPYYPATIIGHRVTYLFYFLMSVPAVCGAAAHMILDQNPPKLIVLFYLSVVLVSFYIMFPFKVIPT